MAEDDKREVVLIPAIVVDVAVARVPNSLIKKDAELQPKANMGAKGKAQAGSTQAFREGWENCMGRSKTNVAN